MMDTFSVEVGEGRYQVQLLVTLTSEGIVGMLTGGERPHVGGVVLSVPRPSLTGLGTSCDSWVIPVTGHKDIEVAKLVAEIICKAIEESVSLTAGIHISGATGEELEVIKNNCLKTAHMAIKKCMTYRNL